MKSAGSYKLIEIFMYSLSPFFTPEKTIWTRVAKSAKKPKHCTALHFKVCTTLRISSAYIRPFPTQNLVEKWLKNQVFS